MTWDVIQLVCSDEVNDLISKLYTQRALDLKLAMKYTRLRYTISLTERLHYHPVSWLKWVEDDIASYGKFFWKLYLELNTKVPEFQEINFNWIKENKYGW